MNESLLMTSCQTLRRNAACCGKQFIRAAACLLFTASCAAQEGRLGAEWLRDTPAVPAGKPRSTGQAGLIDFAPIAADGSHADQGRLILAQPALIAAAQGSDVSAVQRLLERGVAVNLRDAAGDTALFHAVRGGNIDIARALLERGANPNLRGGNGLTPLMQTVLVDDRWTARLLLRHGADPDGADAGGQRPLFAAIRFRRNALAAQLLDANSDIQVENAEQQSALVYAIVEGNVEVVGQIVQRRRDLNREDVEGRTALYWALFFKRFEMARILQTGGAKLGSLKTGMPVTAQAQEGISVPLNDPGRRESSMSENIAR